MSMRRRVSRRTANGRPIGGGGARNPQALANLKRGGNPPTPGTTPPNRQHGGYATVAAARMDAKQREIFDALAADAPVRAAGGELPAADGVLVSLLAQCLVRLDDVGAYLRDRGLLDGEGNIRSAVALEAQLRREAADYADAMAMTPRSRSRLGVDQARVFDLAQHWAAQPPAIEGTATEEAGGRGDG